MPQDSVLPSQQPPDPSDARPKQNQQNEVVRLQSEITDEIARDAPEIATSIFGDNADHPDMAQVSNQQLDQVYRQKFLSGSPDDRQWLQGEARRDPAQFLKIAERINVKLPEPTPPPELPPPAPPIPAPIPAPVALPPPPMAAPPSAPAAPIPLQAGPALPGPMPGAASVTAPAAVILGPNGQPLPPSGM